MNEVLTEYVTFLWNQMQHDWSVFTNPWVLYTIIPAVLYFLVFLVKWYILLAPITVPITTYTNGMVKSAKAAAGKDDDVKKEVTKLLKG